MKVIETIERKAALLAERAELGFLGTVTKGLARLAQSSSRGLCKLQSGYVRQYALAILLGAAAIMAWFVFT